jgi:hypothetical protein
VPDPEHAQPEPSAQYNFTDPDSRIMLDSATKSFAQAYNAQAAVDGHAQIIVACGVTQQATDVEQFVPMLERVVQATGQAPTAMTADAGYFSETNLAAAVVTGVAVYVPPDRLKHRAAADTPPPPPRIKSAVAVQMREKLTTPAGRGERPSSYSSTASACRRLETATLTAASPACAWTSSRSAAADLPCTLGPGGSTQTTVPRLLGVGRR